MDFAKLLQGMQPSINRFFSVWSVVRVCPENIQAPPQVLSLNILTLAISLAIFLMARIGVAGHEAGFASTVAATAISSTIVFLTGYVVFIIAPGQEASDRASKWGVFFVMMWLTSLLLTVICDALPFWLEKTRLTTFAIDYSIGIDSLTSNSADVFRGFFFTAAALLILLIKTKFMDDSFRIFSRCAIITCLFGLIVNFTLLEGFIYGHLIG